MKKVKTDPDGRPDRSVQADHAEFAAADEREQHRSFYSRSSAFIRGLEAHPALKKYEKCCAV
jgi:hypothetical protein